MTHNPYRQRSRRLAYAETTAMLGAIKSADLQDRLLELADGPLTAAEIAEGKAIRAMLTHRARHNCNPI